MARRVTSKGVHRRAPVEVAGATRFLGPAELAVLAEVHPLTEELVGERFRLTSFGPTSRTYDVVTLAEVEPECRAIEALAKLTRYDRSERPITKEQRVSRFYRICLQDDNILTRADEGYDLRALLLYVLTHELIHIVRFESFQVSYNASGVVRDDEERVVDKLTREVLGVLKDRAVERVIEGLSPGRVDVFASHE
jgi:hypothetical protein